MSRQSFRYEVKIALRSKAISLVRCYLLLHVYRNFVLCDVFSTIPFYNILYLAQLVILRLTRNYEDGGPRLIGGGDDAKLSRWTFLFAQDEK